MIVKPAYCAKVAKPLLSKGDDLRLHVVKQDVTIDQANDRLTKCGDYIDAIDRQNASGAR